MTSFFTSRGESLRPIRSGGTASTWVTTDITPTDPVQRSCIWNGGGSNQCRNLLDFNDITTDAIGRVLIGYADGCTGACVSDPTQNTFDAWATIARQTTGKTLFSRFDGSLPSR